MTPAFAWISLASLVGTVVIVQSRAEVTTTLNLVKISNQHEREARDFALRSEIARQQLDGVLAKEQREHRLLLARREAKQKWEFTAMDPDKRARVVAEFVKESWITYSKADAICPDWRKYEIVASTPTTEAGAS